MKKKQPGKINFCFGIHNHQPVGNFDFVFEKAYSNSYEPLLNALVKFPQFKFSIHYSGPLLLWLEKNKLEHFKLIQKMVNCGQLELLSGGFYEPLLSVIPAKDARSQILKQNKYLKEKFNCTPKGMWLAERIWEPHLPSLMDETQIKFTILDDTHFKYVGIKQEDLYSQFITEDEGKSVRIFPIDKKLRYTIPFEKPEITIEYLKSIASDDENKLVVFADDGEKFGVWPGTYEQVYKEKWIEKFIELLFENSDWINILHFSEAVKKLSPKGPVYLPLASYAEMMEWTLPTESLGEYINFENYLKKDNVFNKYETFVRGGYWRNFLSKYPDSNNMHKKMIYVTNKVDKLLKECSKEELSLVEKAKEHVLAAQCNCAYWHGVFGGLYLNHLRNAIYKNLIQAEIILEKVQAKNKNELQKYSEFDFNMDGKNELIIESKIFNLYFAPANGGTLFELDYKPKEINLLDTFTRQKEGSHDKLLDYVKNKNKNSKIDGKTSIHDLVVVKEEGLENYLIYDYYPKKSFIDHFLPFNTSIQNAYKNNQEELGDFLMGKYSILKSDNKNFSFFREGKITVNGFSYPISLKKCFTVDDANKKITVKIIIKNLSHKTLKIKYATEFNFGLLAGIAEDRYYFSQDKDLKKSMLNTINEINNGNHLAMIDEFTKLQIHLSSSQKSNIWFFPVETVSLSEAGFEKVYQSSNIFFTWDVTLKNEFCVQVENSFVDI